MGLVAVGYPLRAEVRGRVVLGCRGVGGAKSLDNAHGGTESAEMLTGRRLEAGRGYGFDFGSAERSTTLVAVAGIG